MSSATAPTIVLEPLAAVSTAEPLPTASALIESLCAKLARLTEPLERLRFDTIADELSRLDGHAAADLLDQPLDRFGGAYVQLPSYSLAVLAAAAFARHGLMLAGRDRLLRIIRQQTRAELVRLPLHVSTLWLIPATIDDRTAVHVGALLQTRAGETARPWLWAGLPSHGRFRILGTDAADHPAAAHYRCDGITDFAHLAVNSISVYSCAAH